MRGSKKIPDMSIYQASDYWDEHDFTEFEDTEEVKGVRFDLTSHSLPFAESRRERQDKTRKKLIESLELVEQDM